jgi:hypothetical protein
MTTAKKSKAQDNGPETTGYSGSPEEGQPPPKRPKSASDAATLSDVGVTEPSQVSSNPGSKEGPSDAPTFQGRFKLKGATYHAWNRAIEVDIPGPVTEEGLFNVFKVHFPDAIQDGFTYEDITPPPPETPPEG